MKNLRRFNSAPLAIGLLAILSLVAVSCSSDDDPAAFTLTSAMVGTKDLNGATFATDVPADAIITVVFTDNVDEATATNTNVSLKQGDKNVPVTITVAGNTITVKPTDGLITGTKYTFAVSPAVTSRDKVAYTGLSTTFTTSGIGIDTAPQSTAQTLYVQFDNDINDVFGNATVASQQVAFTADRFGNANGAANFRGATAAGNGDIVELSGSAATFINPSMSYSIWFKIDRDKYKKPGNKPMMGIAAEKGYFFEMGDGDTGPNWLKATTNHKVDPDPMTHGQGTAWNDVNITDDNKEMATILTSAWHHMVMTYNAASYEKVLYIDGVKAKTWNLKDANNEWNLKDMTVSTAAGVDPKLALGYFCSKNNTATDWANYSKANATFVGAMDDLRIWKATLSSTEVASLYTSEKP